MKDTVITFMANLKHDIRNRQSVEVGSGVFTPAELQDVLDVLEAARVTEQPYDWERKER